MHNKTKTNTEPPQPMGNTPNNDQQHVCFFLILFSVGPDLRPIPKLLNLQNFISVDVKMQTVN